MFNIPDFIKYLPDALIYIVSGFLFIKVFNFINFKPNDNNISNILVSSVSIGFIIKSSYEFLNPKNNMDLTVSYLILCMFSIILGYIASLIYNSKIFGNILKLFKISRTVNKDIWDDIIDKNYSTFIKIQMKTDKDIIYYGRIKLIEENNRNPYILLWDYQTFNNSGKLIDDYSGDRSHQLLLDSKEAMLIEMIYNDDSDLL